MPIKNNISITTINGVIKIVKYFSYDSLKKQYINKNIHKNTNKYIIKNNFVFC